MEIKHNSFARLAAILLIIGGYLALLSGGILSAAEEEAADKTLTQSMPVYGAETAETEHIAAVISCKGMIDDGLYQSLKRRSEEAIEHGATYLIFDIGTYGGVLKSGDDISKYFILDIGKKVHTVAYITTEAISAGAMISVACKDIIMLENTTIGDCAPIMMGGKLEGVEREKVESFTRAAFVRAAEANGYPEALLKAMVSRQLEIFKVKNIQTGKFDFFEFEHLPKDPNLYDLKTEKLVVRDDELLTLTASKAQEYGIARTKVKDLDGVFEFLAERDGVVFSDRVIKLKTLWSEEMVRWINSPAVMGILVMLAMLGVYIELNSPGLGLPGLLAVICIVIIIASKYLTGMANWVEVAIFIVGLILLAVEIFIIPGFGIAGAMGIVCICAGLFGMLIKNPPDKIPWPKPEFGGWDLFVDGLAGLCLGFAGFIVLAYFLAKYLPETKFLGGLMLGPGLKGGQMPVSMTAASAESKEQGVNIGDTGYVVSPLRPSGQVRFDRKVVDVVAEADFIENGKHVIILEIHGNRVIVRQVEE